ncbi:MAG TPA: hypothetical protein DCL15_14180 [Chloroflexi bacterium]|nr:hypothetical protein [Chloroflexota bacterium]HHW86725.1 hypothetical protein [Chloroflexota bacterium]
MTSLPFSFDGVADASGVVRVTRRVPVGPMRIQITHFSLRTHNGCNSRIHNLRVLVNSDEIYRGEMHDCADLTISSSRAWRGVLRLQFMADGFDVGEHVNGAGEVQFRAALL